MESCVNHRRNRAPNQPTPLLFRETLLSPQFLPTDAPALEGDLDSIKRAFLGITTTSPRCLTNLTSMIQPLTLEF